MLMVIRPRDGRPYYPCRYCGVVSIDTDGPQERDQHERDAHPEWFALVARFQSHTSEYSERRALVERLVRVLRRAQRLRATISFPKYAGYASLQLGTSGFVARPFFAADLGSGPDRSAVVHGRQTGKMLVIDDGAVAPFRETFAAWRDRLAAGFRELDAGMRTASAAFSSFGRASWPPGRTRPPAPFAIRWAAYRAYDQMRRHPGRRLLVAAESAAAAAIMAEVEQIVLEHRWAATVRRREAAQRRVWSVARRRRRRRARRVAGETQPIIRNMAEGGRAAAFRARIESRPLPLED